MAKLGEQAVGSIVKLNVNGTARDFIVVHQGRPSTAYDSSCDGTWLLMKDIYEKRRFLEYGYEESNDYETSTLHSYLNSTFLNLFDSDIKAAIKQAKIPYKKNESIISGTNGLAAKVFLLSATEVGYSALVSTSVFLVEGAVLSYFTGSVKEDPKRIAYLNGTAYEWWLRTSYYEDPNGYDVCVTRDGSYSGCAILTQQGVRPALILDSSLSVSSNGTISNGCIGGYVTIGGVSKELTGDGYINIGGVWKPMTGSYTCIGSTWKSLS